MLMLKGGHQLGTTNMENVIDRSIDIDKSINRTVSVNRASSLRLGLR